MRRFNRESTIIYSGDSSGRSNHFGAGCALQPPFGQLPGQWTVLTGTASTRSRGNQSGKLGHPGSRASTSSGFNAVQVTGSKRRIRQLLLDVSSPLLLVPTMGALHAGHLELIQRARKLAGKFGTVVVSIYVNPTQFGPDEDLQKYPRPWPQDRRMCEGAGVNFVFRPEADGLYKRDHSVWINEEQLSSGLCGAARPGHFRGVCTVVAKLFELIQPDCAVFGEKDFQQLAIIRRMVRDLDMPVKIVAAPTVREPDGLAMSSRNKYLSPEERQQALCLRQALLAIHTAWLDGEHKLSALIKAGKKEIKKSPLAELDYLEVVDGNSLGPPTDASQSVVALGAIRLKATRLIDNIQLKQPDG